MPKIPYQNMQFQEQYYPTEQSYYSGPSVSLGQPVVAFPVVAFPVGKAINDTVTTTFIITNTGNHSQRFYVQAYHQDAAAGKWAAVYGTLTGPVFDDVTLAQGASKTYTAGTAWLLKVGALSWLSMPSGSYDTYVGVWDYTNGTVGAQLATTSLPTSFTVTIVTTASITSLTVT